jgi:hypothetical protein
MESAFLMSLMVARPPTRTLEFRAAYNSTEKKCADLQGVVGFPDYWIRETRYQAKE